MCGKRQKGDAKKLREKNKTLLMDKSKVCVDIRVMFSKLKVCISLFTFYIFSTLISMLNTYICI